jgi:multidrug transporter EmrE-like cation transporter
VQAWAMKQEPLGSSYVVVLGLEALLAVIAGYFLFAEQMTPKMISGVVLVVLGIILLRIS